MVVRYREILLSIVLFMILAGCNGFSDEPSRSEQLSELPMVETPSVSTEEFFESVEHEDLEKIRIYLQKGFHPDVQNERGYTPLEIAAVKGNAEIVRELLQFHADPNKGVQPLLLMAIKLNHFDVATLLIQHGAQVNVTNEEQETPLSLAVDKGNFELASLLLKNGADPNPRYISGETPIFRAIQMNDPKLVNLLIDYGADLNVVDKYEYSPLLTAIEKDQVDITLHLLNKGADVQVLADRILIAAAEKGYLSIIEKLPDECIDPYGLNRGLVAAVKNGHIDVVRKLLQEGADPNSFYGYQTTLMIAIENGDLELANMLRDAGGKVLEDEVIQKLEANHTQQVPLHLKDWEKMYDILQFQLQELQNITIHIGEQRDEMKLPSETIDHHMILQSIGWINPLAISELPFDKEKIVYLRFHTENQFYEYPYDYENNLIWIEDNGKLEGYHAEEYLYSFINSVMVPDSPIGDFFKLYYHHDEDPIDWRLDEIYDWRRLSINGHDHAEWERKLLLEEPIKTIQYFDGCVENVLDISIYASGIMKIGSDIIFMTDDYETKDGIKVGISADEVIERLGEPNYKTKTRWNYKDGDYTKFQLLFENDKVKYVMLTLPC